MRLHQYHSNIPGRFFLSPLQHLFFALDLPSSLPPSNKLQRHLTTTKAVVSISGPFFSPKLRSSRNSSFFLQELASSKELIMLGSTLLTSIAAISLFTTSTCALPHPSKQPATYTPASDLSKLAKLMPKSSLPAPEGELKYVVLGLGTQNYTCTSGNPSAAPGTTGAVGKHSSIITLL